MAEIAKRFSYGTLIAWVWKDGFVRAFTRAISVMRVLNAFEPHGEILSGAGLNAPQRSNPGSEALDHGQHPA